MPHCPYPDCRAMFLADPDSEEAELAAFDDHLDDHLDGDDTPRALVLVAAPTAVTLTLAQVA